MVENVLCVVDGSAPSGEVATLVDSLLPSAVEVVVLQVVPQLPYAWTAWPSFPDAAEDLAKAWAYVSEVAHHLQGCDSRVRQYGNIVLGSCSSSVSGLCSESH